MPRYSQQATREFKLRELQRKLEQKYAAKDPYIILDELIDVLQTIDEVEKRLASLQDKVCCLTWLHCSLIGH